MGFSTTTFIQARNAANNYTNQIAATGGKLTDIACDSNTGDLTFTYTPASGNPIVFNAGAVPGITQEQLDTVIANEETARHEEVVTAVDKEAENRLIEDKRLNDEIRKANDQATLATNAIWGTPIQQGIKTGAYGIGLIPELRADLNNYIQRLEKLESRIEAMELSMTAAAYKRYETELTKLVDNSVCAEYEKLKEELGEESACTDEEYNCAKEIVNQGYDLSAIMTSAHEMRDAYEGEPVPPFGDFLTEAWAEARVESKE